MLGAPVYGSSWPSRIPFPTSHPLWAGNLPTKATEIARRLESYDAIFALGGKSLITILYTEGSAVPPGCDVFQMSADVRDLGRTYATPLSVVGDIKASLNALTSSCEPSLGGPRRRTPRARARGSVEQKLRRRRLAEAVEAEMDAPVTTPLVAARQVDARDRSRHRHRRRGDRHVRHVRSFLNSPSRGSIRSCAAADSAGACPRRSAVRWGSAAEPVVCLVGDGAALYSPQALWTAAHEKLPVTFVVMNNREYNVLKNFMKAQPDYLSARSNRFIAMDIDQPAIDYLALARSMGVPARRIERATDIAGAVEAGIASGHPNLIEIPISAT